MNDLGDRELRYFIAVADELNFTRAAERLRIAQPPLSRAIRQLERKLGAELFHRDSHRVRLTDFGAELLEDAREAIERLDALSQRARRAATRDPTLVVTAKPGLTTEMLRKIIAAYAAGPDARPVEIAVSGYRAQADLIRAGDADLALLSSPYDLRGLDSEPLSSHPRVAALPARHALARRAALRCQDLRGRPIPSWPEETATERTYWAGADNDHEAAGQIPLGPAVSDPTQLLEVVALGQAVALIPAPLAENNHRPDIAYRPVLDASPYLITIAWPAGSRSRPIADLVRTAIALYGEVSEVAEA